MPGSPKKRKSAKSSAADAGAEPNAEEPQRDGQHGDEEQIRRRAYEIYLERGGAGGDEREDWFRAERESQPSADQGDEEETERD
ncbi:MAG TPA: DUF2934 domain-containing protein [Gemmatimonadaceae bacterium]|nr:DUF2934 domain-containing protein [Gemmatimonadaceae bacterium]